MYEIVFDDEPLRTANACPLRIAAWEELTSTVRESGPLCHEPLRLPHPVLWIVFEERRGPEGETDRVNCNGQRLRSRSVVQLASAVQPPSTGSVTPLTKPLEAGSARKETAAAMSSGEAKRAIGTCSTMSAST